MQPSFPVFFELSGFTHDLLYFSTTINLQDWRGENLEYELEEDPNDSHPPKKKSLAVNLKEL